MYNVCISPDYPQANWLGYTVLNTNSYMLIRLKSIK